jgi:hypothetical protein
VAEGASPAFAGAKGFPDLRYSDPTKETAGRMQSAGFAGAPRGWRNSSLTSHPDRAGGTPAIARGRICIRPTLADRRVRGAACRGYPPTFLAARRDYPTTSLALDSLPPP